MKKHFLYLALMMGASFSAIAAYQQPIAPNYGAQVNLGAFLQGQAAGSAAYLPAARAVPVLGENGQTVDPCLVGRDDSSGLSTFQGQAVVAPPGSHKR